MKAFLIISIVLIVSQKSVQRENATQSNENSSGLNGENIGPEQQDGTNDENFDIKTNQTSTLLMTVLTQLDGGRNLSLNTLLEMIG